MSECNCVDTGHKQDCPLGKDLRIAAMQEQIAILETSLAERWENLNVQDGIIDGLQEEIAALRESLGLLQIGHDHKATLLASCEIALGERDEKISTLQSDLAAVKAEQDAVFKEAHFLATAIHRKHYHEVTQWKPLDYTAGLISQIDNMAAGLSLDLAAARAELERAREVLIDAWFESEPGSRYQWQIAAIRANAEARYAREIAHKGEEG